MQTVTIQDFQKVTVSAQPEDASNSPAANFNPATWAVDNGAIAAVANVSADGLTADVVAKGVGTATVTVTGQQGNQLPQYATAFQVTVTPGVPTHFNFVFAAAVNQ